MRMTQQTDYALRMLIYLALRGDAGCTVSEVANAYDLSRNHLLKVARRLSQMGVVTTERGRSGGIALARAPEEITLGAVVREMEESFALVACMGGGETRCALNPACRLRGVVAEALNAYLAVFDRYSLADLVAERSALAGLLGLSLEPPAAPALN